MDQMSTKELGASGLSNGESGEGESLSNIDAINQEYFESYQDYDVHRLMLQDTVRTKAYHDAILNHQDLFKDKVVMDVGAGTGILSLFCAKAGAAKVFAVEASGLAKMLPKVAETNGYKDVIEVVHSKVEDALLNIKVDIIVSEWMGFYLLHESMLDSVIVARDKFLKPEGLMFPCSAQIFASPCKIPDELWKNYHDFWTEKQYGFDLSCFADVAKIKDKPEVTVIPSDSLLSDPQLLWDLNLMKVSCDDLQCFKDRRFFAIEEDGDMQGICIWFTCTFPVQDEQGDNECLSTAPWDAETHWKQTVILFPLSTTFEAGDIVGWELLVEKSSLEPNSRSRSYRIQLQCLDANEEHPTPCLCGSVKCELVRHFMSTHPQLPEPGQITTNVVSENEMVE